MTATPLRKSLAPAALLLLGACTVGPDYDGPPAIASASGEAPAAFARAGADADLAAPRLAEWWTVLDDPVLDRLEQQALAGSPDLALAQARVDEARAALGLSRAERMPSISAMASAAHIRVPGINLGEDDGSDQGNGGDQGGGSGTSSTNFYNLGLNASWEVDLFGGARRRDEAARADLGAAEANADDARVSLTSAVAEAYLALRARQQAIGLARQAVEQRSRLVDLQQQRFDLGTGTEVEVQQAKSALAQAQQQLAPLRAEADGFANALAILAGEVPGAVDALIATPADIPLPPASVAVGDPAALFARRPDIRAAERQLAAQSARIGLQKAALLPRLSFFGILGIGGTRLDDLSRLDDFTAIAAPMLQWNFLDFGRGKAQVGQATARRDQAEAQYRSTVLGALRDVEDALANFRASREAVAMAARASASAGRIAELTRQRQEHGVAALPELLNAQLAQNNAEQQLIAARAQLTADFVTLQKALGLGWQDPAAAQ